MFHFTQVQVNCRVQIVQNLSKSVSLPKTELLTFPLSYVSPITVNSIHVCLDPNLGRHIFFFSHFTYILSANPVSSQCKMDPVFTCSFFLTCISKPPSHQKIFNSVIFSIFTELCDCHCHLTSGHFPHPTKNPTPCRLAVSLHPPFLQLVAAASLLSVSQNCLFQTFYVHRVIPYVAFMSGFFEIA